MTRFDVQEERLRQCAGQALHAFDIRQDSRHLYRLPLNETDIGLVGETLPVAL
jgi:hypothetical protein